MNPDQLHEIQRIIGEAVGAGSTCWNPKPSGVFHSEEATLAVNRAMAEVQKLLRVPIKKEEASVALLDHGYIRFIEHWGGDHRVIEAARMSTSGSFLGWGPVCRNCGDVWMSERENCPEPSGEPLKTAGVGGHCFDKPGDEKLLKYLYDNKHCYDEETEVLTKNGFVRWEHVTKHDELGQWDPKRDCLVYERPNELIQDHYCGPMYRVVHGGVDLLVTPDHKMVVKRIVPDNDESTVRKQKWSDDWLLITASELGDKSMTRYRKHAGKYVADDISLTKEGCGIAFPEHDDARSLLRLMGFFIGDGHAGGTRVNGLSFHLRKKRKIRFLREVVEEVGWGLHECSHDNYIVDAENVGVLFRNQFYDEYGEKRIPKYLQNLNGDDASALIEGLRASDGTQKRGTWSFSTTVPSVAEDLQKLLLHAGEAAHVYNGDYLSQVMVLSRMREPVINQGKKNTSVEQYSGKIFCASTRTKTVIVRRNGKIVVSGNSTPFEFAGMVVEVQAPITVFRQWQRHRSASYNEMSGRYAELPECDYVPSLERLMMGADGNNKQAGTIKGAEALTEENAEKFREFSREAYAGLQALYEQSLQRGIPKELARGVLTVHRYSRMRTAANLRNWLHFLTLRMDPHAQWETRIYANMVGRFISKLFPRTWELFIRDKDYDKSIWED